ncbi:hypothetical protein V1514DRAFT_323245 [Lipomyces japonicus]|uniref:uncharacterized protein n=1 Tax=Lipomyces japonicus TaxID=56871 RepID=UPI0034CE3993
MSSKFNPSATPFIPNGHAGSSFSKLSGAHNASSASSSSPSSLPSSIAAPNYNDTGIKTTQKKYANSSPFITTPRSNQSQRPSHRNNRKSSHNSKPNINFNDNYPDSEGALAEQYFLSPSRNRRNQVSAAHLLNFSLPPRDSTGHRRYRQAPSWRKNSSYAADKAHFVNSNFRFIVHPSGDYSVQAFDPDVIIPWHLILQVVVSRQNQLSSCPICLADRPVASRMARCGHIFCLSCVMRLLESEMPSRDDDKFKKKRNNCPLCLESLSLSDTKSVKWIECPTDESIVPDVGKDVVLRLVMRIPGSILALPFDGGERPAKVSDIPWHFAAEVLEYARIMKGTEDYITEEYEREIRELEFSEQEDGAMFGEDGEWTHKAIERVLDSIEAIKGMGNAPKKSIVQADRSRNREPAAQFEKKYANDELVPEQYIHSRQDKYVPATNSSSSSSSSSTSSRSRSANLRDSGAGHGSSDMPYYFYQPKDASNYFLSSLDIKILITAFGSFAAFPSTVLVHVEHITRGVLFDEDLRKRMKYLAHLPLGTTINIMECDWTGVVKPEVINQFSNDLKKRIKQRRDKEHREERARQKAVKDEDEARSKTVRSSHEVDDYSSSLTGLENDGFTNFGISALRDADSWPALSLSESSLSHVIASTPPTDSQQSTTTVWGTPVVSFSRVADALTSNTEGDGGDDDNGNGWNGWDEDKLYQRIIEEREKASASGSSSSVGKKKKPKRLVLMSTGGARN